MKKPPRNNAGAKKPQPPHCEDCGSARCHPYPLADLRPTIVLDGTQTAYGYQWLCGDCKYLREHPDAPPAVTPPRERRPKPLQIERLFDVGTVA